MHVCSAEQLPAVQYTRFKVQRSAHRYNTHTHQKNNILEYAYLAVVIDWLLLLLHVIEAILSIAIAIHAIHILLLLHWLWLYCYCRWRRARLTYYLHIHSKCSEHSTLRSCVVATGAVVDRLCVVLWTVCDRLHMSKFADVTLA
jgi:hypothetical protein